MSYLVELKNIDVSFAGRSVLHAVDFTIYRNEIVTLIGPNGAGKSTLAKVVLGLIKPDRGSVARVNDLHPGYVPQSMQANRSIPMSVAWFLKLGRTGSRRDIQSTLNELAIADLREQSIQDLSGGELKRVILARALLKQPRLLVLDEPTAGVDVSGQAEIYEMIQAIRDKHQCGILLISHDLHLVMAASDRVVCLNHHVCCSGEPESISRHPEYLSLFGDELQDKVAVYSHRHDHQHNLHGDVEAE